MNRLRFYYDHSLVGYFCRRAKEKWLSPTPPPPAQFDICGVTLQVDCLPKEMRNIVLAGCYEMFEMKILPSLISESDKVIEIGSAIGLLGLYCQKILRVKKFVGFEPNPVTLGFLQRNYALNGIVPNIVQAALAATDSPVSFHTSEMFWADSIEVQLNKVNPKIINVEGLTFSSLLRRAGGGFNALIIDVEGAEQHIPFESLPAEVNKILIEIHPDITGPRKAFSILERLIQSGFAIHDYQANCWGLVRM